MSTVGGGIFAEIPGINRFSSDILQTRHMALCSSPVSIHVGQLRERLLTIGPDMTSDQDLLGRVDGIPAMRF